MFVGLLFCWLSRWVIPVALRQKHRSGPAFWHYPHYGNQGGAPYGAVRDGDWKLIEWYEDGSIELFNLANDLSEAKNLAVSEPNRSKEFLEKLREWRIEVAAKMPTANRKRL